MRGSSGISTYSKSSKKAKPHGFANGFNLSAYQKKMITPTEIYKE